MSACPCWSVYIFAGGRCVVYMISDTCSHVLSAQRAMMALIPRRPSYKPNILECSVLESINTDMVLDMYTIHKVLHYHDRD